MVIVPLTMAVLATEWPGHFVPWHAVYLFVPGASAMRAVSRIGIAIVFSASLGVALLVDSLIRARRIPPSRTAILLRRRDERKRALIVMTLIAAIVAEQVQEPPSYEKSEGRARVANVLSGIGTSCTAFLYTPVDSTEDPAHLQVDAMWASMQRGTPTVNGYSGNEPPTWDLWDVRVPTPQLDSVVTDNLVRWAAHWHLDPASVCRVRTPPS
jgi:hypothetical protein